MSRTIRQSSRSLQATPIPLDIIACMNPKNVFAFFIQLNFEVFRCKYSINDLAIVPSSSPHAPPSCFQFHENIGR